MSREELRARILDLITRLGDGQQDAIARDALLEDLRAHQARCIKPYGRLVSARGPEAALPTDVFRHARVAAHPPSEDVRIFRTSGTTSGRRGEHAFRELALYDAAAKAAARHLLFRDVDRIDLVIIAPNEDQAMDSSLSYMLARFAEWFGKRTTWCWDEGPDVRKLEKALHTEEPIAIVATSFALVFALDELRARFTLPEGSRIMQTGGFKGKTRELEPAQMRLALSQTFGVSETSVVSEYGMTELSSQMYEGALLDPSRRAYVAPGWVRTSVVDPETLEPVPEGEVGILRIDDAANLDSCCALQTADLARAIEGGFELLGRDPAAVPRGCSLAVEEALSR